MSSNYGFEPTLDGLNNIDANSTTTTDIICDNLTVNVSGTAPTMTGGDNSTHLATTAFVDNAITTIGSSYVTLTGTQTISGEKTFSNANTFISGLATFSNGAQFNTVLPTSSVVPISGTQLTNKTYVDSVVLASILPLNNTFTGTNTFNNTVDVVISAVNKLSISSSSITLNPTTTITNQIGGVSKMTINSTTTIIDNSSFLQNRISGVNKLYISNTNITTNPTTTTDFQINSNTIISLSANDTTFNPSTTVSTKIGGVFKIQTTSTEITNYVPTINSGLTYPLTTTTQLGYFTSTTSTNKFTTLATNLASLSLPVAGCYLVEGQFQFATPYTAVSFTTLSLNTTSATVDKKRQMTIIQTSAGGYGNRLTSIFNVSAASTVYLVGLAGVSLGATSLQDNYISVTRIA